MKLSKKITERTTELTRAISRRPADLEDLYAAAQNHIRSLRYDAHLAFLDGKVARSVALNREALTMCKAVPAEYRI